MIPAKDTETLRTRAACFDDSPSWLRGHWRDWHRGHGCNKDDGKPRTDAGWTEINERRGLPATWRPAAADALSAPPQRTEETPEPCRHCNERFMLDGKTEPLYCWECVEDMTTEEMDGKRAPLVARLQQEIATLRTDLQGARIDVDQFIRAVDVLRKERNSIAKELRRASELLFQFYPLATPEEAHPNHRIVGGIIAEQIDLLEAEDGRSGESTKHQATGADRAVRLPDGVPQGPGDSERASGSDRHTPRGGGLLPGGHYGERTSLDARPFIARPSPIESADPTLIVSGPLSYWAALMKTVERDAFGHDPRPRAADDARASIMFELDRFYPEWRILWDH